MGNHTPEGGNGHPVRWCLSGLLLLALVLSSGWLVPGARSVGAVERPVRLAGCTELLVNGGFEQGGLGWTQSSARGYSLIDPFNPHSGRYGAYLAGYDNARDQLGQQVSLPGSGSSLQLRWWWALTTEEPGGAFDYLTAELVRQDGTAQILLQVDNTTAPDWLWNEVLFDVTSYAGQVVTVRFTARTDGTNPTHFFVDDVSLAACPAGTPTATVTATREPTATATPSDTARPSGTVSPSVTTSATVSPTPTGTLTPTVTGKPSATPTVTGTVTPTTPATMRRYYLPYITKRGR